MSNHDFPKACDQYGASMGRPESYVSVDPAGRLRVYRVPLDRGGYDPGGAYWGTGAPLYCISGDGVGRIFSTDTTFTRYVRAYSRAEAYRAIGLKFGGPHPLARPIR